MQPPVVALMGAVCWFAVPASAQPSDSGGAAINWSRRPGAEACPDVGELARRVSVQLKRDAFVSPAQAAVLVDVTIQPAQRGFRVRILLSSKDQETPGERELASPSPDCNDAVDSAALAIALMLDPDALTRGDEPEPAPEGPPNSPAATPSAPSPVAPTTQGVALPKTSNAPAQRPRARGRTRLAAGGLGAIDQVPGTDFGVVAGLRVANLARSAGFDLNVAYLAPRELKIRSQAGGHFSLVGVALSHVWSPFQRGPWALSLLTGAQVARMFAGGFGFTASNHDVGSWMVSGTLEGEAALALSERWDLALRVGLGLPVWRDTFEATTEDGTTTILDPAPLFGSLGLALAFSP